MEERRGSGSSEGWRGWERPEKKIETSYNFLVQATLYPNSNLRSVTASVNIMAFKHGVINRHCGKSKCIQITYANRVLTFQ